MNTLSEITRYGVWENNFKCLYLKLTVQNSIDIGYGDNKDTYIAIMDEEEIDQTKITLSNYDFQRIT